MLFKYSLTSRNYGPLVEKAIKNAIVDPKTKRRTAALIKAPSKITSPTWQKACSKDIWAGMDDVDVSGALNKFSLDPHLRRFYAKKEEIITQILGWLTSQAPDSIRPALLAALQIKRLLELLEYIKCAKNILDKITKTIRKNINGLINAQKALMTYLAQQRALLQGLMLTLVNLPNMLMASVLTGLMKSFQNIVSEVVGAIMASDLALLASALGSLAMSLAATIASLKQASNFAQNFPGAAFGQLQRFIDDSKRMLDPGTMIDDAKRRFEREFGWLVGAGPECSFVYYSIVGATPVDWQNVLNNASTTIIVQAQLASAQSGYSDERAYAQANLSRMSAEKLSTYSNPKFPAFATPSELSAYSVFLSAPVADIVVKSATTGQESMIPGKKAAAKILADLMRNNDEQQAEEIATKQAQIRELEKILYLVTATMDALESVKSTEAQIAAVGEQIKELEARLVETQNTDLESGVAELQALVNGAYGITLTNDNSRFESFDAVTTNELVKRLNNTAVNQWYNVQSIGASGTLVVSDPNIIALYVAQEVYDEADARAIGLRLIIDNGLWIIECYGDGKLDDNAQLAMNNSVVTYGRFTSVPMAPTPSTLVLMTYAEWKVAKNHPSGTTKDPDFIIYNAPISFDLKESTYHALNPITERPWERYLSQQEIDYRESNYLEALKAFNLSPISNAVTVSNRSYSLASDSQLSDLLLGKKPYINMQIPARSINLQVAKIRNRAVNEIVPMPILPGMVFPFAVSASWGFVPKVL